MPPLPSNKFYVAIDIDPASQAGIPPVVDEGSDWELLTAARAVAAVSREQGGNPSLIREVHPLFIRTTVVRKERRNYIWKLLMDLVSSRHRYKRLGGI
jgi:hypothetical protein